MLETTGAGVVGLGVSRNLAGGNEYANNTPIIAGAIIAKAGVILQLTDYIHIGKAGKRLHQKRVSMDGDGLSFNF